MIVLAEIPAVIVLSGDCTFASAVIEQERVDADDGELSFDASVTIDDSFWKAVIAEPRWTGSRLIFDGVEFKVSRAGTIELSQTMPAFGSAPDYQTLKAEFTGVLFTIPRTVITPTPYDPCPPPPAAGIARISPRSWGNKPIEFYASFGASPAHMNELKLFQGYTFQKKNTSDATIRAEFQCVDQSLLYADVPLCYELQPFSGKRRGQIVKELAALVGIDPATVTVPIGGPVNKPILLSNGSLLPFITELGVVENWFPYFDENGRLVVIDVEMKETPDWVIDCSLGDYDLEQIEETPPVRPPSTYYTTAALPIKNSGPGSEDLVITSITTEEDQEFYNPQCVKVRPSGAASYLNGDGTYRAFPAQILMLVSRITRRSTSRNGQVISKHVSQEGFYNPNRKDDNFDIYPAGTNYDDAYGNKSFHRDEVETFQTLVEQFDDFTLDDFGTLYRTVQTLKGWYAPHRALQFADAARTAIRNVSPGAWVYAGGTQRTIPVEAYGIVKKVETDYEYEASAGYLARKVERTFQWGSPRSRADIIVTYTIPDTGPPAPPIPSLPPPLPPPPAPPPPPPPQDIPPPKPPVNVPPPTPTPPPPGTPPVTPTPVSVNLSGGNKDFFNNYTFSVGITGGQAGTTAAFAGSADVIAQYTELSDLNIRKSLPVAVSPQPGTFSPAVTVASPGGFNLKLRFVPPLGVSIFEIFVRVSVTLNGGGYAGEKGYSNELQPALPTGLSGS